MNTFYSILIAAIAGFFVHAITMKINYKLRTIDDKIKVYKSIIGQWVKMRNLICNNNLNDCNNEFDLLYGESQFLLGAAILICENTNLTDKIDKLNEIIYRTEWDKNNFEVNNSKIDFIKKEAILIVKEMREDIENATVFELKDFIHIIKGIFKIKK